MEGYGPLGSDGKKELKFRNAKSKVTLRHLLTHSAGLAYYWNHDHMVEYYKPSEGEAHAILPFVTGDISDFASPAVREAGEQMEYSPVTDWLGQVRTQSDVLMFRDCQKAKHLLPLSDSLLFDLLARIFVNCSEN